MTNNDKYVTNKQQHQSDVEYGISEVFYMKKIWLLIAAMALVVSALWQALLESANYYFFRFDSKTDFDAIIFTSWRELAWMINILLFIIITVLIFKMKNSGKAYWRLNKAATVIASGLMITIIIMAKMVWNMNGEAIGWYSLSETLEWSFIYFSSAWKDQSVLIEIPLFVLAAVLFFRHGERKEKSDKMLTIAVSADKVA